jgi:hypothetical protein
VYYLLKTCENKVGNFFEKEELSVGVIDFTCIDSDGRFLHDLPVFSQVGGIIYL